MSSKHSSASPSVFSGRWQSTATQSAPISVESFLIAQQRAGGSGGAWDVTAADVHHLFALKPTTLCLDRCRFVGSDGSDAFVALTEEVARSTVLVCLSLTGCMGVSPASRMALWNALLENTSIESLSVADLGLTSEDATFIEQNVLPWNRGIVEWNFKGNVALGDDGVRRIVDALVSGASSVQRLNLCACGMQQAALRDVLLQLRNLTSLSQLDVALNDGYHNPEVLEAMRDVDEVLHRNTKLMHPGGTMIEHASLYAPSVPNSSPLPPAQLENTQQEAGGDAAPSPSALGSSSRRSSVAQRNTSAMEQRVSSPIVSRRLSLQRRASIRDTDPTENSTQDGARRALSAAASFRGKTPPPLASSQMQRRRSNAGPPDAVPQRSVRRQSNAHQEVSARRASSDDGDLPHGHSTEMRGGGREDVSSIVDVSAISSLEGASTSMGAVPRPVAELPFPATPSPRRASNVSATSATPPSNVRRASAAATAGQPASPSRRGSTPFISAAHTPPVNIAPVTEGMEEWQRIKDQYNGYIRRGGSTSESVQQRRHSAAASPQRRAALEAPKYVLGKLVSKERNSPSSAFRPRVDNVMYVREPMPAERRKYAPWVQQGGDASSPDVRRSSTPTSQRRQSYVGNRIIVMDEHSDPLHRTAIRIVDGGDVTMISNDPRDIGYVSRRLQTGEMVVRSSAAFSSNTCREVRWGTDPTNQLARSAQAPPPGSYNIPSTFDETVRRAQGAARGGVSATGKRVFGSTASERTIYANNDNGVPGPGFYEIP